jgi:hypothetical protein
MFHLTIQPNPLQTFVMLLASALALAALLLPNVANAATVTTKLPASAVSSFLFDYMA